MLARSEFTISSATRFADPESVLDSRHKSTDSSVRSPLDARSEGAFGARSPVADDEQEEKSKAPNSPGKRKS